MASSYPGSADTFDTIAVDKKQSDTVGGRTHRVMHNDLGDAIEAVQTELGTNPSGGDATVAARLDKIDDGTSHLSGTGAPEGVVTAAPGSTWLQTDATTDVKGWLRWIKATGTGDTGWVAGPEADTGWRDVSGSVTNGAASECRICRIGNVVELRIGVTTFVSGNSVYTSPTGFRPYTDTYLPKLYDDAANAIAFGAGDVNLYGTPGAGRVHTTYTTTQAWPSSLPGTAV